MAKPPLAKGITVTKVTAPPQQQQAAAPVAVQVASVVPAPALAEADATSGLLALLKIEADAREVANRQQLLFLAANESRKLTRARQIFVCLPAPKALRVEVISGLSVIERNAPVVQWIEQVLAGLGRDAALSKLREFDLKAYASGHMSTADGYPFPAAVWLPMLARNGALRGGMLMTREIAWTESDVVIGQRLAATYAHALSELSRQRGGAAPRAWRRWLAVAAALLIAGSMAIPVSMKALAPFEIAPRDPFIVAAPIDGIVERIDVEPNQAVTVGQPLAHFVDTVLRNRLDVAEREVLVAGAQVRKNIQLAFDDARGQHDLSVAMSDLQLKTAERDFARDLLAMTVVQAPRAGIAIYANNSDLMGRPLTVGERIMQIADPAKIDVVVDLPIGDAIVLEPGQAASLYFDSDPLHPQSADIVSSDYQAHPRPGNGMAFRVLARLKDAAVVPRLGLRGTAQLYGRSVPLGLYLFRRPLAAARQWIGL